MTAQKSTVDPTVSSALCPSCLPSKIQRKPLVLSSPEEEPPPMNKVEAREHMNASIPACKALPCLLLSRQVGVGGGRPGGRQADVEPGNTAKALFRTVFSITSRTKEHTGAGKGTHRQPTGQSLPGHPEQVAWLPPPLREALSPGGSMGIFHSCNKDNLGRW